MGTKLPLLLSASSVLALSTIGIFTDTTSAYSVDPDGNKKAYVCKYVGKPGHNERLKGGKNPISVSKNNGRGHMGANFNDAHHNSKVVGFGNPGDKLSTEEEAALSCQPEAPVVEQPVEVKPEQPEPPVVSPVKPEAPKPTEVKKPQPAENKPVAEKVAVDTPQSTPKTQPTAPSKPVELPTQLPETGSSTPAVIIGAILALSAATTVYGTQFAKTKLTK